MAPNTPGALSPTSATVETYGSVKHFGTTSEEHDTATLLEKPVGNRFLVPGCPLAPKGERPCVRCICATLFLIVLTAVAVFAGVLLARSQSKDPGGWFFLRDNPVLGKSTLLQGNGFDEDVAKTLLVYAGAAYSARDGLSDCLPNLDVDSTVEVTVDGSTIAAYVGTSSDDFIIVAVEGTNTNSQLYQEWKQLGSTTFGNTNALVVSYWNSVASAMYDEIVASLQNAVGNCPSCPVYFTGHSLGGATVTLLLTMMYVNNDASMFSSTPSVVTFGQPRVGDVAFSELANQYFKAYRVTHYKDPVVHVPCCKFQFSYDGAGECQDRSSSGNFSPWHNYAEIYYSSDDMSGAEPTICTGDPSGEDAECANSIMWTSYDLDNHYSYYGVRVGYMCSYLEGNLGANDFFESLQDSGEKQTPAEAYLDALGYDWHDAADQWNDQTDQWNDQTDDYSSQFCI